jgi:hypothetical protein
MSTQEKSSLANPKPSKGTRTTSGRRAIVVRNAATGRFVGRDDATTTSDWTVGPSALRERAKSQRARKQATK